jgi:hypothetical protein
MVAVIRDLKVGSRLRVQWEFEERPRVVKVEVLQAPKDKDTPKDKGGKPDSEERRKGTVVGILTAKEKNFVEIKADGEEKARRYVVPPKSDKELLHIVQEVEIGSRVRVEWDFLERQRVLKMEVLKKPAKDK